MTSSSLWSSQSSIVAEDNHPAKQPLPQPQPPRLIQTPLTRLRLRQQSRDPKNSMDDDNDDTTAEPLLFTALILLNAPMVLSPLLQQLWNSASYRVCADGGANRLRHAVQQQQPLDDDDNQDDSHNHPIIDDNNNNQYIPNLITGDLDSLTNATREYYETRHGVEIRLVLDQDCNDLDKALTAVQDQLGGGNNHHKIQCVVYGAFGGRLDQEMASLQALYTWQDKNLDIFLYDDNTMAFLLPAGTSSIELALPRIRTTHRSNDTNDATATTTTAEGPTCGLIPLGGTVESVTTEGLQWNLVRQSTRFGGLVSTSNRCIERTIHVQCSEPLIFTAQVHAGIQPADE